LEEDLPFAVVDLIQIQQVLMNLMRSGIEALESQPPRKRVLDIHSLCRPTGNISIEVHDHGRGVEDPHRVFEAFFSTKRNDMGMGLAICRSIINGHDGQLWAEKQGRRRRRFHIHIALQIASCWKFGCVIRRLSAGNSF
jgi:signal transduction histidine kinase